MGGITCDIIGHFALEVSWIAALRSESDEKHLDLYYYFSAQSPIGCWAYPRPCNSFYAALTKRNFKVLPALFLVPISVWNRVIPSGKRYHIPTSWEREPFTRDVHGWLQRPGAKLPFLIEEHKQAMNWLRKQGWRDGDAFVCLLVRDSAYKNKNKAQSEYSIRNSEISAYCDAVKWLADRGVWVLRMGKKMSNRLPFEHPRVVDYAFHSEKSDFLDIWLFAHCDLCISTGSGPDVISLTYGRPILLLNYIPLAWFWSAGFVNHVFKKLIWKSTGTPLKLYQYFDNSFHGSSEYAQKGIGIIDLGANEILAAVEETWQRVQQTWIDSEESQARQSEFWRVVCNHPDFNNYHGWIHPKCMVSSTWLNSMQDSFFDQSQ